MMTGTDAGVLPHSPPEVVRPRSRPSVVLPAVMAAEGAAFAVLAGLGGSAAAVVLVTGVVLLAWGTAMPARAMPGWWRLPQRQISVSGR